MVSSESKAETLIANLNLSNDAGTLKVTSVDGELAEVAASTLRQKAMDAASRRERIEKGEISVLEGLKITSLKPMGSTGVNIQFSDGHQKAIFPYSYLGQIAFSADN